MSAAYDNSAAVSNSNGGTCTVAMNVAGGATIALAFIAEDGATSDVCSGVTCNGVAMTKFTSQGVAGGFAGRQELWYIENPTTGSNISFVASFNAGAARTSMIVTSLTGTVNSGPTPFGSKVVQSFSNGPGNNGTSINPSTTGSAAIGCWQEWENHVPDNHTGTTTVQLSWTNVPYGALSSQNNLTAGVQVNDGYTSYASDIVMFILIEVLPASSTTTSTTITTSTTTTSSSTSSTTTKSTSTSITTTSHSTSSSSSTSTSSTTTSSSTTTTSSSTSSTSTTTVSTSTTITPPPGLTFAAKSDKIKITREH